MKHHACGLGSSRRCGSSGAGALSGARGAAAASSWRGELAVVTWRSRWRAWRARARRRGALGGYAGTEEVMQDVARTQVHAPLRPIRRDRGPRRDAGFQARAGAGLAANEDTRWGSVSDDTDGAGPHTRSTRPQAEGGPSQFAVPALTRMPVWQERRGEGEEGAAALRGCEIISARTSEARSQAGGPLHASRARPTLASDSAKQLEGGRVIRGPRCWALARSGLQASAQERKAGALKTGGCSPGPQSCPRIGERGLRAAGRLFGRHHENRGRLASTAFDAARGDVRRASPRTRPSRRLATTPATDARAHYKHDVGHDVRGGEGAGSTGVSVEAAAAAPHRSHLVCRALAPGPHTVTSQSTRQTGRASCGARGAVGRRLTPPPAWVTDAVVPPRALAAPSASQCTHREAPPRQMVVHESRKVGRV
jgi:hypothetical protein